MNELINKYKKQLVVIESAIKNQNASDSEEISELLENQKELINETIDILLKIEYDTGYNYPMAE
jgi:hypothetical protein